MSSWLLSNSPRAKDIGLLVMRIGLGFIFIRHGYGKILNYEMWTWLGSKMTIVGISFAPVFWGFLAAVSEFFGGIGLLVGLGTRLSAFLLSFVMFIATLFHYQNSDPFTILSHPLSLFFVFLGIMIAGSGRYSLDYMFK